MKFSFLPILFLFMHDAEAAIVPNAESRDYSGEENIEENLIEDDYRMKEGTFPVATNAEDDFKRGSGHGFGFDAFPPNAPSLGANNDHVTDSFHGAMGHENGAFSTSKATPPPVTESETLISEAPALDGIPSPSNENDDDDGEELTSTNATETDYEQADYGRGTVVDSADFPGRADNSSSGNGTAAHPEDAPKGSTALSGLMESVWKWMKSSVAAIGTFLSHVLKPRGEISVVRLDTESPPSTTATENISDSYNVKIRSD